MTTSPPSGSSCPMDIATAVAIVIGLAVLAVAAGAIVVQYLTLD